MRLKDLAQLALGATVLVLGGCGGGGDNRMQNTGIEGTGFAMGTVTGFGSVIVNGITFNTNTTTFTIDGRPGTQADLRVGDVVSVVGPINAGSATGTATSVTFDDNVEGPVESIDVPGGAGRTAVTSGNASPARRRHGAAAGQPADSSRSPRIRRRLPG